MSGEPDSEAQKAMGVRLQAAREALGLTQDDMAGHMGVGVSTLSAWEIGRNQIDIVKLAKSATRWGFTTDWVARGDMSGLRKDLADKIEAMIAAGPTPRRRQRGRPTVKDPRSTPPPQTAGPEPPSVPFPAGGSAREALVKDERRGPRTGKIVQLSAYMPA